MDILYRQALSEVKEILQHSEEKIVNKIPQNIVTFIHENMDKEYKVVIDFNNPDWQEEIREETRALLAIIYRDYIVSTSEREKLLEHEKNMIGKINEHLSVEFDPKKVFNVTSVPEFNLQSKLPVVENRQPWYKKIYEKALAFLKLNHKVNR